MSTISKCPKCRQQVAIPDRVDPEEPVRCPLCEAEYPLSEAIAEAPPELVPVARLAAKIEVAQPDTSEAEKPAGGDDRPDSQAEADKEAPPLDYDRLMPSIPTIDPGEQTGPVEMFDIRRADDEELDDSVAAVATRLRNSAKEKSIVRELVGVAIGGVVGLVIAYYLLNFFGGAQFDKLNVYLPGCPHTYDNWPGSGGPEVE